MTLKRPSLFIWLTLFVAWCFDLLFWKKTAGISFAIFITLVLAAAMYLAYKEGAKPAWSALILLPLILFFSVMTFVRLNPLAVFLNVIAVLVLMVIFAHTFLGGRWPFYNIYHYIVAALSLTLSSISRPLTMLDRSERSAENQESSRSSRKRFYAILRGILLALPVVVFFALLLASADPVFKKGLEDFLELLRIENLVEYLFRLFLILVLAYLLAGCYLHAYYKNHDEDIRTGEGDEKSRLLGFIESVIILGSLNVLFVLFVVVQFRYFFGGSANINIDGYTYAEYARRGFGELVWVAFFSLGLFLGLSAISKRQNTGQRRTFSALGILLVALVSVILVSALYRLLLYEGAYGFTRLRSYTHVFIYWLAGLLVATVLLELFRRQRFFTLAALIASLGFIASLDLLNVDAFIARQNVARAQIMNSGKISSPTTSERSAGVEQLDYLYLASLSEDVVPVLSQLYQANPKQQTMLAAALACHASNNSNYNYEKSHGANYSWQSFHLSRYWAQQEWAQISSSPDFTLPKVWNDFTVDRYNKETYDNYLYIDGEKINCNSYYYWD